MNTSIANEDVHLWLAFPDEIHDPDLMSAYFEMMSPEERTRQQRFRFERHRHQYLVARALVRTTLSRYTGTAPQELRFSLNRYGRPEIDSSSGLLPLRFNLSHTDGLAALVVALADSIGVDVEDTSRERPGIELAHRFFSRSEADSLDALPPSGQQNRFYEYWTLKEAYVKAMGMGLSFPLEQFSFNLEENSPLRLSFGPSLPYQPEDWQFWLLRLSGHHTGALALNRKSLEPARIIFRKAVPMAWEQPLDITILRSSHPCPDSNSGNIMR